MGKDFINYYKGDIKMGDTPSLAYLMDGDPKRSLQAKAGVEVSFPSTEVHEIVFNRNSTLSRYCGNVCCFRVGFKGPVMNIPIDSSLFHFYDQ